MPNADIVPSSPHFTAAFRRSFISSSSVGFFPSPPFIDPSLFPFPAPAPGLPLVPAARGCAGRAPADDDDDDAAAAATGAGSVGGGFAGSDGCAGCAVFAPWCICRSFASIAAILSSVLQAPSKGRVSGAGSKAQEERENVRTARAANAP